MNLPALPFKASMQLFAATIGFCMLSACHKQERRKNEIAKIELATGDCYGKCRHAALRIDSALNYIYFGGEHADKEGYYKGKISQAMWDTLNKKLEQVHFKQLDTTYRQSVDDQTVEFIIYYAQKVKHIRAQSGSLPDSVGRVFYWIADTYKSVKLIPTQDEIRFTTKAQDPLIPPMPLDNVKFPSSKLNQ
jgi:hypothetical protein